MPSYRSRKRDGLPGVEAVICILGAGGHGQDIAAIAEQLGHEVVFYDDDPSRGKPFGDATAVPEQTYVLGVNDPVARHQMYGRLSEMLESYLYWPNPARPLVHPGSYLPQPPKPWDWYGLVVGAGTYVGPGCDFGVHVHIGPGCTITRTKVGNYTTISPGVDIAGDVTIGDECLIGVGAVVSNLVTIGNRCVVGAGAVVTKDLPDGTTWVSYERKAVLG